MITTPVYCTRDFVKVAVDIKETARNNQIVDMIVQASSRQAELELHRRFYPEIATRKFDWPNDSFMSPWQFNFGDNEVISLNSLSSGGTTIAPSNYILRRYDDKDEAPYEFLEIKLDSTASFIGGATFQQSISATGTFGYRDDTITQGTITASMTSSQTTLPASDSSIGVGALLTVGTERLLVQDKSMVDTGQTLTNTLTAAKNDVLVGVQSGASFSLGEVVMLGAEKMRVEEIAANNLIVTRQWDGAVLATHAITDHVFALRTMTVSRGALGSTAASHNSAVAISVWIPPTLVTDYVLALAVNDKRLLLTGFAPDLVQNYNLKDKKEAVYYALGRKGRLRAV